MLMKPKNVNYLPRWYLFPAGFVYQYLYLYMFFENDKKMQKNCNLQGCKRPTRGWAKGKQGDWLCSAPPGLRMSMRCLHLHCGYVVRWWEEPYLLCFWLEPVISLLGVSEAIFSKQLMCKIKDMLRLWKHYFRIRQFHVTLITKNPELALLCLRGYWQNKLNMSTHRKTSADGWGMQVTLYTKIVLLW